MFLSNLGQVDQDKISASALNKTKARQAIFFFDPFSASFPQSCLLAFFSTASSWLKIETKKHRHDERAVDDGLLSLYNSSFHQSLHKLSVMTVTHFVDILIKKWHSLGFEPTYFCSAARTTSNVPDLLAFGNFSFMNTV